MYNEIKQAHNEIQSAKVQHEIMYDRYFEAKQDLENAELRLRLANEYLNDLSFPTSQSNG